jgi:hypothetical protein
MIAHAAADPVDVGAEVGSYFGYTCIGNFISNLVGAGIIIAALAVFIYLVWGGIEWITSTGDKAKAESAQKRISNALVGLAIVAASWAVWNIILYFFGINIDTLCSPNPLGN